MHRILLDVSNSVGGHHFCSMWIDFHQRTALRPTGSLSSANAPWRWRLCLVVWSGTLAGHLARRPCWCKQFRMVWRDTRVPLTSLKRAWSWVAFVNRFHSALCNEAVINMRCGQRTFTSMHFCDSSSLSVSLLHPADDTLWHFKLSGSFPLKTSHLKPHNGQVLLINR